MSDTFVRELRQTPLFGFDLMTGAVAGFDTGYWQAQAIPGPTEDDTLTNLFQLAFSRITDLAGPLVRPMWQAKPPVQPTAETNWASLGIVTRDPIGYVYLVPSSDVSLQSQRQEYLFLNVMFYGPDADANAGILRDGLAIPNNWWYLNSFGIRYYEVGETTLVPYDVNNQFIGRCDLPVVVVRQLNREYPIPTIVQAVGTIVPDSGVETPWASPLPS